MTDEVELKQLVVDLQDTIQSLSSELAEKNAIIAQLEEELLTYNRS